MSDFYNTIKEFEMALLPLDRIKSRKIFDSVVKEKKAVDAADFLIVPALELIGEKWEKGSAALSQVYMSGKICEELINSILPSDNEERRKRPKIAIAVFEDYHILGKRIVYSVLRASGYDLIDWGHGLDTSEIIKRVVDGKIEVLLLSTLMLSSALTIKEITGEIRKRKKDIKIVAGGAPFRFDEELWKEIGADACGRSASDAVEIIRQLAGGAK